LFDLVDTDPLRGVYEPHEEVADLDFDPRAGVLAVAGANGVVLMRALRLELKTERVLTQDPATAIAFSPDGLILVAGFANGEIRIWNEALGGGSARVTRGHLSAVTDLCFSPDQRRLCSASLDNTLALWQMEAGLMAPLVLSRHRSWVWTAVFSDDGAWLYSGSADERIRRWATSTTQLARALCERIPRQLTPSEWEGLVTDTLSEEARAVLSDILVYRETCTDERVDAR
jgi:WD40 repeat protein